MHGEHRRPGVAGARAELSARLRVRREEIEAAVATRVFSLADPTEVRDPEYLTGLRASLSSAVEYSFAFIERGEPGAPPVPPELAAQARAAARNRVSLATVLRRYLAGYTHIVNVALEEAEASGLLQELPLRDLVSGNAVVFDRLIAEVTAEYQRELASHPVSREQCRADGVSRLLAGEPIDPPVLGYELEGWHIGVVAAAEGAEDLRRAAVELDKRLLVVRHDKATVWAWFGSIHAPDRAQVHDGLAAGWVRGRPLAVGEPGHGIDGWRLSHRQAATAFPIARHRLGLVLYADVALLASTLRDDVLATSLHRIYIAPLEQGDEGKVLRDTLRAYAAAGRNVSAAAAALGVSRNTVTNRLRTIEARLGRYLDGCMAEMETALRLDEADLSSPAVRPPA